MHKDKKIFFFLIMTAPLKYKKFFFKIQVSKDVRPFYDCYTGISVS